MHITPRKKELAALRKELDEKVPGFTDACDSVKADHEMKSMLVLRHEDIAKPGEKKDLLFKATEYARLMRVGVYLIEANLDPYEESGSILSEKESHLRQTATV